MKRVSTSYSLPTIDFQMFQTICSANEWPSLRQRAVQRQVCSTFLSEDDKVVIILVLITRCLMSSHMKTRKLPNALKRLTMTANATKNPVSERTIDFVVFVTA